MVAKKIYEISVFYNVNFAFCIGSKVQKPSNGVCNYEKKEKRKLKPG